MKKILTAIIGIGIGGVALFVLAQTQPVQFPIPELGNCADKTACRAYCDKPEHADTCLNFAESHKLLTPTQIEQGRKLEKIISETNPGPGGCTVATQCRTYCADSTHSDACLAFAQKNTLLPADKITVVKKLAAALKGTNGNTPGDCNTKEACIVYCANPVNAVECLAFAKRVGLVASAEADHVKKALNFMENGQAPGGCTTKDACQTYCHDQSHMQECMDFGAKVGVMSSTTVAKFKTEGFKGPGGCNSRESCEAFCNQTANQDVCLNFAKAQKIISTQEIQQVRDGLKQVQEVKNKFDNLPPILRTCLEKNIGAGAIEQMRQGTFVPGPELGRVMQICANQAGQASSTRPTALNMNIPPEVLKCVQEQLGSTTDPTTLPAEKHELVMRACLTKLQGQKISGSSPLPPRGVDAGGQTGPGLLNMRPEVKICIEGKVSADVFQQLMAGNTQGLSAETKNSLQVCFQNTNTSGQTNTVPVPAHPQMMGIPPAVRECLQGKIGADVLEKLTAGQTAGLSAEVKTAIQTCFQNQPTTTTGQFIPPGVMPKQEGTQPGMNQPVIQPRPTIQSGVADVRNCMNAVLGPNGAATSTEGKPLITAEQRVRMEECTRNMAVPQQSPSSMAQPKGFFASIVDALLDLFWR